MSCDISKGKAILECKDNVGGLRGVYALNYNAETFTTSTGASGGNLATGITGSASSAFYFELKNTGNNFNQEFTSNRDTGTTSFKQTLTFVLTKLSAELEFQLKQMAFGRPQFVVRTNSDRYFLVGKNHGTEVSTKGDVQGAMTALAGYTITAVAEEEDSVYYLTSTAITQLQSLVSSSEVGA